MADNLGSGTAAGLVEYLDSLVAKGRSRDGVVTPLKTAIVKVLEKTESENWGAVDVTHIDVEDVMARFKNFTMGDYTDASYRAYELRIKRAINWYKNFLSNPGWYPKERQRAPRASSDGKTPNSDSSKLRRGEKKGSGVSGATGKDSIRSEEQERDTPIIDAIAYPFPLVNGKTARIYMPRGVTKSDVQRLATFLEALVIEQDKDQ